MRIKSLAHYQKPRDQDRTRFDGLSPERRRIAEHWLAKWEHRYKARYSRRVPPWLHAIYCGQAKSLALHPRDAAWGRRMRAKRGGYAVQQKYREEGRNPTAKATARAAYLRRARKRHPRQVVQEPAPPTVPVAVVRPSTVGLPVPRRYRTDKPPLQAERGPGPFLQHNPASVYRAPVEDPSLDQRRDESAIS
jgi:hypothetical protein